EVGPFGDDVQLVVRDDRGDLDDDVLRGIETGHLQIHPDQHAANLGRRTPSGPGCAWAGPQASRQSAYSKPGTTTHATSTASSLAGRAVCQTPPGTRRCGAWSDVPSVPSTCSDGVPGPPGSSPPRPSTRGPPRWWIHSSSERTTCQAECSPGSSR